MTILVGFVHVLTIIHSDDECQSSEVPLLSTWVKWIVVYDLRLISTCGGEPGRVLSEKASYSRGEEEVQSALSLVKSGIDRLLA